MTEFYLDINTRSKDDDEVGGYEYVASIIPIMIAWLLVEWAVLNVNKNLNFTNGSDVQGHIRKNRERSHRTCFVSSIRSCGPMTDTKRLKSVVITNMSLEDNNVKEWSFLHELWSVELGLIVVGVALEKDVEAGFNDKCGDNAKLVDYDHQPSSFGWCRRWRRWIWTAARFLY